MDDAYVAPKDLLAENTMMMYQRSDVAEWVAKFIRPIRMDFEQPLLAAFDILEADGVPTDELLLVIAEAASDRRAPVYHMATEFLGDFAIRDSRAIQIIRDMAISKRAHVRHNAILCLNSAISIDFCAEIIFAGLRDKSSKVRTKAADWGYRITAKPPSAVLVKKLKKDFLRLLNEIIVNEPNAETRSEMEHALISLRKHPANLSKSD